MRFTTDSGLKKEIQTLEDRFLKDRKTGWIRVLERLGPFKELLSNPTPWKNSQCGHQGCWPCQTKEGSCRAKGCTYQIACLGCRTENRKTVYIGETHRTLWDRIGEHREALKQQKETSCLHRHWQDYHHSDQGDNPKYEVKVLKTFRSATERQVSEALSIEGGDYDLLLNSKTELGRNAIAVQKTGYGDRLWDLYRGATETETVESKKRTVPNALTRVDPEKSEQSTFCSQYSQRRKRLRTEIVKESPDDRAGPDDSRTSQKNRVLAETSLLALSAPEKDGQKAEHRTVFT